MSLQAGLTIDTVISVLITNKGAVQSILRDTILRKWIEISGRQ